MNNKRHKQLLLSVLTAGVLLLGCEGPVNAGDTGKRPAKEGEPAVLSKAAEQELSKSFTEKKKKLAVVFAVDEDGRLQAFRRADQKTEHVKFPFKAGEVAAMLGITVIKTTNPKYCWFSTSGSLICISW
jgi:hypothetical protein